MDAIMKIHIGDSGINYASVLLLLLLLLHWLLPW